jgi:kanamycin nucleotidyltransferase
VRAALASALVRKLYVPSEASHSRGFRAPYVSRSHQIVADKTQTRFKEGPRALSRTERLTVVDSIVARLLDAYHSHVVAIGLYGSTGRGADGTYSDIEMFCVIDRPGEDRRYEWIYGDCKIEIEVFGEDVIRRKAAVVDEGWPVTHAEFAFPRLLRGAERFFSELRELVFAHPDETFAEVERAIIVDELYEGMGKVRNAASTGDFSKLASRACRVALMSALLLGLARRKIYTAAGLDLAESMQLLGRPDGHDELCRLVMSGELADSRRVALILERHWRGVVRWIDREGLDMSPRLNWPV